MTVYRLAPLGENSYLLPSLENAENSPFGSRVVSTMKWRSAVNI
ncbi:MAG: hypothetical protein WAP18_03400 [Bacteroidales bacterium]